MLHWRDMDRTRIARAAVVIMLGNLVTSALGFVRQFVTARYFGASSQTDAWSAAYTVPQMFYDLVIGGAIAAALIPSFTRLVQTNRQDLWRVVDTIFVLAAAVLVVLIGILELAAHPLMALMASGFNVKHGGGRLDLSVSLVRVILPTLFFWGMSAISLATLYSLGKRVAASFATACFHLGIIIAAVILAAPLGIIALPIGAATGAAAQFLMQVPSLVRARRGAGWGVRTGIDWRDPTVRKIIALYAPVALGILISIAGQIADVEFKTHLPRIGDFFDMQLATTLIQFPVGIVVAALGLAVLPLISTDASAGRIDDLKDKLALGFRLVLVLMVPAAFGFAVLGHQIVALLFQHGRFHAAGTANTATALLGYAPQLPFIGIDQLLIFAFYARHNTVTPMLVGVFGVGVYLGAALLLIQPLGILGLALANTIQIGLHALVLLALLFRSVGTLAERKIWTTGLKVLTASGVMALTILLVKGWVTSAAFGRYVHLWSVALPMVAAIGVYALLLVVLRVEEVRVIRDAVASRFRGTAGADV